MPKLKSRDKFVPGGYKWIEPSTKFQIRPWSSFDSGVQQIIAHRMGNAAVGARVGWATDYANIAEELDSYNAQICAQLGFTDYITSDGGQTAAVPFSTSQRNSLQDRLRNVAAGKTALVSWIKDGAEAVAPEVSEERARVCAGCPNNQKGDLLRFFTVPVSEAIRVAMESKKGMGLSTSEDDNLGVCSVCDCPMRLKVHIGLTTIIEHLRKETFEKLPDFCWIKK